MTGLLETLLVAVLLAGLMGGVHRAAMCGGIAGAVCSASGGAARWPRTFGFNRGRIATYALAGAGDGALPNLLAFSFVLQRFGGARRSQGARIAAAVALARDSSAC